MPHIPSVTGEVPMPKLNFSIPAHSEAATAGKLQFVTREPLSAASSFLVGLASGLAVAGALFAICFTG
jgi:hypothetical protein